MLVRQITRTGSVGMLRFTPDGQYLMAGGYEPDLDRVNGYATSTNSIRIFRLSDGLTFKTYDLGTEYPGVGHNSWTEAYATKELYNWLWKQQRK